MPKGEIAGKSGDYLYQSVGSRNGGIGVDLLSRGVLTNDGTITGGSGGNYTSSVTAGGIGVNLAVGGTLSNSGLIAGGGSSWYTAGGYGGDGVVFGSSGLLHNSGTIAGGGGGTLALNAPMQVTGTISGFVAGDTIDLLHMAATGFSFSPTTDVLTVTGTGGTIAALHFAGSYTTASFAKAGDHNGGTFITHT